jgi:uncharacterized membrane protein
MNNVSIVPIALASSAALGCAIVGGMFYAFSSFVMRALGQIPAQQGIAAMKSINLVVITPSFMLPFAGTALLCLLLAGGSLFWWPHPDSGLVFVGAVLYALGCIGLTMVVNQPMNLRLGAMPPDEAQAYWPQYLERWITWNHVRTAAALLASVLFVFVLAR